MNTEEKSGRLIKVIVVWCIIIVLLGASYKFLIRPRFTKDQPGTSAARYDQVVNIGLDSFSG